MRPKHVRILTMQEINPMHLDVDLHMTLIGGILEDIHYQNDILFILGHGWLDICSPMPVHCWLPNHCFVS
jgi:hypothetical protein